MDDARASASAVEADGAPSASRVPNRDRDVIRRMFETGEHPYKLKLARKPCERQKAALRVKLLKVQDWVKATNQKIVVLPELARQFRRPARSLFGGGAGLRRIPRRLGLLPI